VLQELVLSHRVLHCRRSELYWECRSGCQIETGLVFDRLPRYRGSFPALPPSIQMGATSIWWKWMESYSQRYFSFPKDKLPGLAGIVQHYQMATKDVPILGMRKSSFHQDLLWMRIGKLAGGANLSPHHLSNVPSWTWLSCPYEISFDFWKYHVVDDGIDPSFHDHVHLIESEVVWTRGPFTSDVKSTRLVLEGPVREVMLNISPRAIVNNPPYLDVDNEKPDFGKGYFPWRCAGQFDGSSPMTPAQYLCLLLRSRVYAHDGNAMIDEIFLILEPCTGTTLYRRVGIGIIYGQSRNLDLEARRTLSLA
jgi:hypothetical protein